MKHILTFLLAALIAMFLSATAWGVTKTSTGSGSWSAITWSPSGVPGSSDDVVIAAGNTVTLDNSYTVGSCTVNGTGILDASTFTLTVSGAFTLQSGATFEQGGSVSTVPGGSQAFDNNSTYIFNGSQSVLPGGTYGNVTWSSSGSPAHVSSALTVNGNLSLLNCADLQGNNSSAKIHTVAGNVTVDGSSAVLEGSSGSLAGSCTWNITGNVTTQNSGVLRGTNGGTTPGNTTYNIGGNFVNNGSVDFSGGANSNANTVAFNGSSQQTVSGNAISATNSDFFQNLTINNSAGVVLSTDVEMTGALSLLSGVLTNSTHLILDTQSSIARTAGSLNSSQTFPSGFSVTYLGNVTTGSELPTVASGDLGDLTINTSGTVTLSADATVNGALTFTSGKLSTSSHTLTLSSGGNDMVGEGAGQYVIGNLTVTKGVGSSASTLGGIGVSINSGADNLGNVTVTRVSGSGAAVTISGKTGINRKWTISSSTPPTSGRTLTFTWVSDDDNSKDMTTARVWQSINSGTTWSAVGSQTDVSSSDPRSIPFTTTSFGQWTVADGADPLPVELTSFTATERNNEIELAWATATEVNNLGFDVERSTINNQQSTINNWTKVGFVAGHGTTNAPQSYSFTDASVRVGTYSYRLKQIDHDGNFVYNKAIEATLGVTPGTVWLDNNYPNPFNPSTKISFILGTAGRATLKVYNILGQEVATLADGQFNSNEEETFSFDASKLSSGIYYYQLKSADGTQIKKMMLLK
ncbi:MAG: T9SS type A sorting domain-containing protein [Bacteroidota bacterium]